MKSPAAEGRANEEAEGRLSEIVGAAVRLHRGARSRSKTFETDAPRAVVEARLRSAFGTG